MTMFAVALISMLAMARLRRRNHDGRCGVTTITAAAQLRYECDQPISAVQKESLCCL
jgi:hypothetical protein